VPEPVPAVTISVIVPTRGRRSLCAALDSVVPQLEPGDEVLVRCSQDEDFGNSARQSLIERARGTHLAFVDDDDQLTIDALATMRLVARQSPGRIIVFRMRYLDGTTLWREPAIRERNVGAPMLLVPNARDKLGRWENPEYPRMADYRFLADSAALQGEPLFREEIVAHVRSDRRRLRRGLKRITRPLAEARYRIAPRTRLRRLLAR
jgi:glycosyltransferase involved in cell wall biosynthesis